MSTTLSPALATAAQPTGIDADALAEREGSNLLAHVAAQRQCLLSDADTARQLGDVVATVAAERAARQRNPTPPRSARIFQRASAFGKVKA